MALKLLRRDSVLRTTFLREFCVGRCVSSHPGLLQTLGRPLQTPQHFAFAQEYAPYGDLSGMLQEKARLDRTAQVLPQSVTPNQCPIELTLRPPRNDLPISRSQHGCLPEASAVLALGLGMDCGYLGVECRQS